MTVLGVLRGTEGRRRISSVQQQSVLERFLDLTNRTVIAVGRTNDLLQYLMILLIHDLELSRPKESQLMNSGLSGFQVGGGLKPNR
jgi:hypothetical protein